MTTTQKIDFLTLSEKLNFQKRPCNQCTYLKKDMYANYGFCVKYKIWNPTGLKECI